MNVAVGYKVQLISLLNTQELQHQMEKSIHWLSLFP